MLKPAPKNIAKKTTKYNKTTMQNAINSKQQKRLKTKNKSEYQFNNSQFHQNQKSDINNSKLSRKVKSFYFGEQ